MHAQLEQDKAAYKNILQRAEKIAIDYLEHQQETPPGRLIEKLELADLPQEGIGAMATLQLFEKHFVKLLSTSAGPRYFGFVTGGSTPASVAGDWLVSAFDQNACGSNDSIAPQIEHQTIHYFRQLFGLADDYFGSFVTGATVSNLVGLSLGRQWIGEQLGINISEAGQHDVKFSVISATPHSSILKSLAMLGIGRKAIVRPGTLAHREAVDIASLEEKLRSEKGPCIVVGNAGTVNTVDFDDLSAISSLKKKYSFWLHVDAAFGGFAALSPRYQHLMDGINAADSITIDAHKWLNVPYDAAMQFTRHRDLQLRVFQNSAAYLGDPEKSPDFFHYTPENSRRWRALPSWFSLIAYGREGHREIVERNCESAKYFGERLEEREVFQLLAPVNMNVVCFALREDNTAENIAQLLAAVRDDGRAFFTPTVLKGTPAIRAAVSNWQTEKHDMDLALEALHQCADQLNRKPILAER